MFWDNKINKSILKSINNEESPKWVLSQGYNAWVLEKLEARSRYQSANIWKD